MSRGLQYKLDISLYPHFFLTTEYFGFDSIFYVLIGISWFASILNIFLIDNNILAYVIEKGGAIRSVPVWVSIPVELVFAGVFMTLGHSFLAFFWLIQMFAQERAYLISDGARNEV